MATIRVNKTKDYTIMSNIHLRDSRLTLKAKGLLSIMFSLPEDWDYSVQGLVSICMEGQTAIESALNELKTFGYLVITKKFPNETTSKKIEYIYDIFETPQKQEGDFQGVENQGVENHPLAPLARLNIKESITKDKEKPITINSNCQKETKKPELIEEIFKEFSFTEREKGAIRVWLRYKKEKKQTYAETGLRVLLKKISQWHNDKGEEFVIRSIEQSIASNYTGLFEYKENNQKTSSKNIKLNEYGVRADYDEKFVRELDIY